MELIDTRFNRAGYPKTVEYTESDMPQRWDAAWKKRNQFNTEYYKKETSRTDIFYTLNSQGYREKEWNKIDWNNSYLFIGCSHTFGVGVSETDTIPKLMEEYLDGDCINLGIPGGSNALSMFNSSKLIENNVKPKAVFFQRTYHTRWFDYNKNDGIKCLTINDDEYITHYKSEDYVTYLDDSISNTISSQWKYTCPLIEFIVEDMVDNCEHPKYIARDGCHYNRYYFKEVVKKLFDKYDNIRS